MGKLRAASVIGFGALILATSGAADSLMVEFEAPLAGRSNDPQMSTPFKMLAPPVRGAEGPASPTAGVTTASTSIVSDGNLAFVADPDSGSVIRTSMSGKPMGRAPVRGASQVAFNHHSKMLFATDRSGDRVAVIDPRTMKVVSSWKTPAEPYGLALTPDGRFALVTTIADRKLAAIDTTTGQTAWTADLIAEPRGLAISPDGREATITFLTSSSVAKVDLVAVTKRAKYVAIGKPHTVATSRVIDAVPQAPTEKPTTQLPQQSKPRQLLRRRRKRAMPHRRFNQPQVPVPTFARGAFATTYLKNAVAVIPYQRSTPVQMTNQRTESRGTYGGGGISNPPIVHRVAFVGPRGDTSRAHLDVRVPRAVAYDTGRDLLYVAGKGDDRISLIAEASQPTAHLGGTIVLRKALAPQSTRLRQKIHLSTVRGPRPVPAAMTFDRCGPSGLAIADSGELLVHCGISHNLMRVKMDGKVAAIQHKGADFGGSRLSRKARKGREIFFRAADTRMSGLGAFACANCHPDGRADGLSWRIQGTTLQTPFLTGRLSGTHPFKWDGQDATLNISLTQTVRRLGGTGIQQDDAKALEAFLQSLPRPRAGTTRNRKSVARGKKLFYSKVTGCSSCHSGKRFTDGKMYELAEDLGRVDTPSLIGIKHSAPYYHDGSAATLDALLLENGSVHGMGRTAKLDHKQRADLIAFLETL
jgi:DNA-binding beta-propeller fold protein YncE